ncbi:MAG: efflux RND transporter periplasmic adaptor subunit [Deltaproteobacteria bacterium]|jgi:cobalt-zinc-cadmium efflux system membrane fusion protein|nr:efflux RND transporter periplasmic adaptor subunit [Deltaproteobacteria bacterium]
MKNKFFAVMAVVVAATLNGCSSKTAGSSSASFVTARNVTLTAVQRRSIHLFTVEPGKFRKTVEATGTVNFDRDQATTVLAPFSGPVSKLLVSLGAHVRAGEPLAVVNSPGFATAVSAYRKALASARTARRLADLDEALLKHQSISEREAEQAESVAVRAEADRDAALQTLLSLKVDPRTIKVIQEGKPVPNILGLIRSPIAGTVVEKLITPGELLQAGSTPCFTVANLSRVWVMAHLFGSDIASVRVGDPAEVITGISGTKFPGTVENIAAEVDPVTRSVAVRVVVQNPGDVLKNRMYLRVLIRARRESAGLLVPVSAILRDSENLPFVYVALPDGSYARQHVSLGYRAGNDYEITEGLKAGEHVVVEGGIFVQFVQTQNQ